RELTIGAREGFAKSLDLLESDVADHIDDGELTLTGGNDGNSVDDAILEGDIDIHVLLAGAIAHLDELTPTRLRELAAQRIEIGLGIDEAIPELVVADLHRLEPQDR